MQQSIPSPLWGQFVPVVLTIGTVALWMLAPAAADGLPVEPWRIAGQLAGLVGMVLLGLTAILSARIPLVERFCGGLDRVYRLHRTVSVAGFLAVLYHPFFLAFNAVPPASAALRYLVPGGVFSYNLGIIALYLFVAFVVLTMFAPLPYRAWKWTHIFMGLPLAMAVWHVLLISSDVSRFVPLRIWVLAWGFLGLGAAVYRRFLYGRLSAKFAYRVVTVHDLGAGIIELTLKAVGKAMRHTPGQFVFLSVRAEGMSREKHPFSISSSPGEPLLRLSIKRLGDFTGTVSRLRAGDDVLLYGPHGMFGARALAAHETPQIWIAGGIGVTPFLSMLRDAVERDTFRRIHLVVATRSADQSPYREEIDALVAASGGVVTVTHHCTDKDGRLDARHICELAGAMPGFKVFLCGPTGMMEMLADQYAAMQLLRRDIVYEDFSFLS